MDLLINNLAAFRKRIQKKDFSAVRAFLDEARRARRDIEQNS